MSALCSRSYTIFDSSGKKEPDQQARWADGTKNCHEEVVSKSVITIKREKLPWYGKQSIEDKIVLIKD